MERTWLKNGELGYRKTIINSNSRVDDMKALAMYLRSEKCHTIVYNQSGLTIYSGESADAAEQIRLKTKGRYFNELLFYVYKRFDLGSAPLVIIGRRKVDRGLGFHYAPRNHYGIVPKTLEFDKLGPILADGQEGLVWTDIYLGHVEIREMATQKAGRLAGIVAQTPQYPLRLTWWTDEETAIVIKHQNDLVDTANDLSGCMTINQVLVRASQSVPPVPEIKTLEDLSPDNFDWGGRGGKCYEVYDSLENLNRRKKELNPQSHNHELGQKNQDGFYVCALSGAAQKLTAEDMGGFKKVSSNLPKNHTKMRAGETVMRVYVFYENNETGPNNFKLALRWVKCKKLPAAN